MAFLPGGSFNAADVDPSSPREILPKGDYRAHIVKSDLQQTKSGGTMLVLEFDILSGEHQGRKVWDRLNLVNNNQQAVEIAQRALSAICRATGVMNLTDSEQLHFKPLTVCVAVEAHKDDKHLPPDQQRLSNQIKGYKNADGSAITADGAAKPAGAQAAAGGDATAAKAAPAWKRHA